VGRDIRGAEKMAFSVIPSEARNPSSMETQEKEGFLGKNMPRNDGRLSFSAASSAATSRDLNSNGFSP
jgi:hypothetical protein